MHRKMILATAPALRFRRQDEFCPHASTTFLVWCFEYCFKDEHCQTRAELADIAGLFGFDFVCHRKCAGFMSWLQGTTGSVLLFAEWREAKPIMQELDRRNDSRDFRMCVVTRAKKMHSRACAWAEMQNRSTDIAISFGFMRQTVEELIAPQFHAGNTLADESDDENAPVWPSPAQPTCPEPCHWISL